MSSLLSVTGLGYRYPGGVQALSGIDLQLEAGGSLGVVGESGSGKSTLARLLCQLIAPGSGRILLQGEDWTRASPQRVRSFHRRVQLVFQDPLSALSPRCTVEQIIREPLLGHQIVHAGKRRQRVLDLLTMVGLEADLARRYPHQLSGGQRQRVVIARALAVEPQLLIADEPLAALDVSIQAQMINLLQRLRRELNLALIVVSHDLAAIACLCEQVMVLREGMMVERGDCRQVFSQPTAAYTRELLAACRDPLAGIAQPDQQTDPNDVANGKTPSTRLS
ncbi:MAG: hypothetical protein Tsb002_05700 [Wenzhouxiangellaceae bacterium]